MFTRSCVGTRKAICKSLASRNPIELSSNGTRNDTGLSRSIVFDSVEAMLDVAKPEVVSDYGSIYGHLWPLSRNVQLAALMSLVEKTIGSQFGSRAKNAEASRQARYSFYLPITKRRGTQVITKRNGYSGQDSSFGVTSARLSYMTATLAPSRSVAAKNSSNGLPIRS